MQHSVSKADKRIPLYFVAFFVVLAVLDGIFVYLAVSTHTGVVTENAYQKGLNYNQTIEASKQQEALGWQGDVVLDEKEMSFELRDKNGDGINDAKVEAYFMRVTQAGYDFSVPMYQQGNGIYSNNVEFPLPGQWNLRVVATWNKQQYQHSQRLIVQ